MAATLSKSIYLGSDGSLAVQDVIESYEPINSEALVHVKYSGINLLDQKGFYFGLHSIITGYDFSGTVIDAGPTSRFKPGDAIFGMAKAGPGRALRFGTHQDTVIADARLSYRLPATLEPQEATVLTLASHTAVDALFNCLTYGFSAAGVGGADPRGKPILIWGGGSSVGLVAIQIAKAAGFSPIFVTASPTNHATLKSLGATHCFDYKSPTVVDEDREAAIAAAATLTSVFDSVSVGAFGPHANVEISSPALARRCCSDDVPEEELRLASTGPVPADPAYRFSTSYRPYGEVDFTGHEQDPEWPIRARKVVEYLLEGDVHQITIPNVTVVQGAEAGIREIQRVAQSNVTLEKVAIKHPM